MKKLIFGIIAILLLVITSSCTADEIDNNNVQTADQQEVDPTKVKPPTGG